MNEQSEKQENPFLKNIKKDFFYGLMVIFPLFATIGLVIFSVNFISGPISKIFGQRIPPIISFLLSIVIITGVGIAARNFIGKLVIKYLEDLMNKIPIISSIYKSTKQVVNAFTLQNKKLLSAVLVEYPRKGIWALAFVTRDEVTGLIDKDGTDYSEDKCSLFVPTTPNPTSGYFIYVNKKDVIPLAMNIEDSIKVLMSAGMLAPKVPRSRKKPSADSSKTE